MDQQTAKKTPDKIFIGYLLFMHFWAVVALFFFNWFNFTLFFGFYILTALGITLGFHRLFTHRSFKVPKWLEYILAVMGTLAVEGTLRQWVAHHRMHHAFSDTDRDPHNAAKGFWHSHIGWFCVENPHLKQDQYLRPYARDIDRDPFLSFLSDYRVMIGMQALLTLIIWTTLGFGAMLWGIVFRIVFVYHVTWLVNSAAHKWGYKNYELDGDLATNNWWVALLALGEGWHNNHHYKGEYANHGQRWFEFDFTYQIIKLLKLLGLATQVKTLDYKTHQAHQEAEEAPAYEAPQAVGLGSEASASS